MGHSLFFWIGFHLFIILALAIDFFLFRYRAKASSMRKAAYLSVFWVCIALLFNGLIYLTAGKTSAFTFFTAYLVEKSLSIDNLFVFLLVFKQFHLSQQAQRKILFWGILSAIVFRMLFILLGIELLTAVHWMIYPLGVFLCITGVKLLIHPGRSMQKRGLFERTMAFLEVSKKTDSVHFFVREKNKLKTTLLFYALLRIESADILFALDSIPAVLAITMDPFIAYTSNIFAILGLRALYFTLSPLLERIRGLYFGLSAILVFIGTKMLLSSIYPIPLFVSLAVIAAILSITALFSSVFPRR